MADPETVARHAVQDAVARRLVLNHGLNPLAAHMAATRMTHGLPGRNVDLARDELHEVLTDISHNMTAVLAEFLRRAIPAMRALGEAATRALGALGQLKQSDFVQSGPTQPARPHDRPAWQSPYGPPARRR